MADYKTIVLKRGKESSLQRFHPWIFSGAILRADEGIEEGEFVRVLTEKGDFIAVGHAQVGSIAVRVLSFDDITIDHSFWAERLQSALQMRQAVDWPIARRTPPTDWYMAKATTCQVWSSTAMDKPPSCRLTA